MIRLVSFDLDGTLVDTAGEIAEAVHRTFDEIGLARRADDEIVRLIGRGTRELLLRLLSRVTAERPELAATLDSDAVLACFEHHYAATAGQTGLPFPGCVAALESLAALGVRRVCVTNKEQRHAERVLAATGLAPHFELLIGGDTLPFKKPDARVFGHVLAYCGIAAPQAAHLGDSAIDIETARNGGVAAWAVPFGYNAGVPIAESAPDRLFDTLPAVAAHVAALNGKPERAAA